LEARDPEALAGDVQESLVDLKNDFDSIIGEG
jgi:hypothetical protein